MTNRALLGSADDARFAAALLARNHSGAAAVGASVFGVERDTHFGAAHRVTQRNLDLGLDVASARRRLGEFVARKAARRAATGPAAGESAAQAAEELLEEIAEAATAAGLALAKTTAAAPGGGLQA